MGKGQNKCKYTCKMDVKSIEWGRSNREDDNNENNDKYDNMHMYTPYYTMTRKNRVRNDQVREILKVAPLHEKLREERLRWFGHVQRRDQTYRREQLFAKIFAALKSRRQVSFSKKFQ